MSERESMQRGGMWAAIVLFLVTALVVGVALPVGFGGWVDGVVGLLLFMLVAGGLMGITAVIKHLLFPYSKAMAWWIVYLLVGMVGGVLVLNFKAITLLALVVLPLLLLGLGIGAARNGRWQQRSPLGRISIMFVILLSACLLIMLLVSGFMTGSDTHLADLPTNDVSTSPFAMENPGELGSFPVETWTYGSGLDKSRPEFGEDADMETTAVAGDLFLDGNSSWIDSLRTWYWGFDETTLPLNGTVWYPDTEGSFPLVLIVHGNHAMEEVSDPGYAWLGELLASRGYVVVAIDENFFNDSWRGNAHDEVDARAWLLLKHLELWRTWQADPINQVARMADLEKIALIGHSRGGEAVAVAARFNQLERLPDDATVELPSDFGIQSVIAVASTESKYKPSGQPLTLLDVNYLLLQGGHDADLTDFPGERQWHRVNLGDNQFKALVWAYRANHGQFNTVWGQYDLPWPITMLQNRTPLLTDEEQRQFAGTMISAFLEATVRDQPDYQQLFQDVSQGSAWLPDDIYVTRYEDGLFQVLADFQEDVDVVTGSQPSVRIETNNLLVWREGKQKESFRENVVAYLGWNRDGSDEIPLFSIIMPDLEIEVDEEFCLFLSVADTGKLPVGVVDDQDGALVDFSVGILDENGSFSQLPLSTFQQLRPPLLTKVSKLSPASPTVILQTFIVPLDAFLELDGDLVTTVTLLFDQTPQGLIMLDDMGVSYCP